MIKCFICQCVQEPEKGEFEFNRFYVAKISNNDVNTLAVLDNNQNWIPFRYYELQGRIDLNKYDFYFDLWDTFLVNNKKELNEYVPTTKFYE